MKAISLRFLFTIVMSTGSFSIQAAPQYKLLIDAGSSGSRLHLFEYDSAQAVPDIQRLFSKSVKPGLSSFATQPESASGSLKPMLDEAVQFLSAQSVDPKNVDIHLMASAGMRLLTPHQQEQIYTQVRNDLKTNYIFVPGHIKTITGQEEGLYSWLSINYLSGTFHQKNTTLGALDMGGASTQIAFATQDGHPSPDKVKLMIAQQPYSVFSKSFLNLGADQARKSMLAHPMASQCFPSGYPIEEGKVGSFDLNVCRAVYSEILQKNEVKAQITPPKGMPFIANSSIYYAYDFFKPGEKPLEQKIQEVCSHSWEDLQKTYSGHPFISNMCANGTYVNELLYHTYQLNEKEVKTFSKIKGQEIDWTLGALLYLELMSDVSIHKDFLPVSKDADLGASSKRLVFQGGTLINTEALSSNRNVTFQTDGYFHTLKDFTLNGTIVGAGGLHKTGLGKLALTGHHAYAGDTRIHQGSLSVNGSIRSHTWIGQEGLLSGTGTVWGNVTNAGVLSPGNSLGIFTIEGNYIGKEGVLSMETMLGQGQSQSDQLNIKGHASGKTFVEIIPLNELGAPTAGDGIEMIKTASSDTNAFLLASPLQSGAFVYHLHLGGIQDKARQSWYLRSDFRPATQIFPMTPFLLQEYAANTLGTLHQRIGAQARDVEGLENKTHSNGIWTRLIGSNGRVHRNGHLTYDLQAFQVGSDLFQTPHTNGHRDHLGIYGVLGEAKAHLNTREKSLGKQSLQASTLGVYWTHYGAQGQYLDTVLQATRYRGQVLNMAEQDQINPNVTNYTASVEAGHRLAWNHLTLEPQAQIIYQRLGLRSYQDKASIILFDAPHSLRARVGLRLPYEGQIRCFHNKVCPFTTAFTANVWRECLAKNKTTFQTLRGKYPVHFSPDTSGTWAEIGVENNLQLSQQVNLFAHVHYTQGLDRMRRRGLGASVGIKAGW